MSYDVYVGEMKLMTWGFPYMQEGRHDVTDALGEDTKALGKRLLPHVTV